LLKRVRRRYLAIAIESDGSFGSSEFMEVVWGAVLKLYGECGASRAGLSLIDFDIEKKSAVLRTGHNALEMVRAALASITKLGSRPMAVHVLAVSGTIKSLMRNTAP